jgi:hypothetical protein
MPPKPKTAATIAITKKIAAHFNMPTSSPGPDYRGQNCDDPRNFRLSTARIRTDELRATRPRVKNQRRHEAANPPNVSLVYPIGTIAVVTPLKLPFRLDSIPDVPSAFAARGPSRRPGNANGAIC